jgi:hypothetical protein
LLRRRNKAVVAVSVREVRLGWKFVRHHANPTRERDRGIDAKS